MSSSGFAMHGLWEVQIFFLLAVLGCCADVSQRRSVHPALLVTTGSLVLTDMQGISGFIIEGSGPGLSHTV